jgi:hypothetical protein
MIEARLEQCQRPRTISLREHSRHADIVSNGWSAGAQAMTVAPAETPLMDVVVMDPAPEGDGLARSI